jgi:hypothetical protein
MQKLGAENGVIEVRASVMTGSLLVLYEADKIQLPTLIHSLLRAGNFRGVEVDAIADRMHDPAGWRVRAALGRFNETVQSISRGRVDMRTAVPGGLASLGLAILLFGKRPLPQWYDLFFWSFVTFVNLNPAFVNDASAHASRT